MHRSSETGFRDLKYFWFRETENRRHPCRSCPAPAGQKQGGFELYLMDGARGVAIVETLFAKPASRLISAPGYPNASERIESGLLSWGGDTDDETNPLRSSHGILCRPRRFPMTWWGIDALRRIASDGADAASVGGHARRRYACDARFRLAGYRFKRQKKWGSMTCSAWSFPIGEEHRAGPGLDRCALAKPRLRSCGATRRFPGRLVDLPFFASRLRNFRNLSHLRRIPSAMIPPDRFDLSGRFVSCAGKGNCLGSHHGPCRLRCGWRRGHRLGSGPCAGAGGPAMS